jgi:hypothetical protein
MYAAASFGHPSSRTFHRAVSPLPRFGAIFPTHLQQPWDTSQLRAQMYAALVDPIYFKMPPTPRLPTLQLPSAVTRSQKRAPAPLDLAPTIRKRVRILSPTDHPNPSKSAPVHLHANIPEILTPYTPHQLPDIFIRAQVCPSSDFKQDADLAGRFPVSAFDGSQYLLVSVFKRYIHVKPLLNRTIDQLVAAYTATHRWFLAHGHHPEYQILENE